MKIKIIIEKEYKNPEDVINKLNREELSEWELLEMNINYRQKKGEAIFEIGAG